MMARPDTMFPGSDFDFESGDPGFVAPSKGSGARQQSFSEVPTWTEGLLPERAVVKASQKFDHDAQYTTVASVPRHYDHSDHLVTKVSGKRYGAALPHRKVYHEFMELDQAGLAVMGYDDSREHNIVAIKRFKSSSNRSQPNFRPFNSDQVVIVLDVFNDEDNLTILYEPMDVTLRQVTSVVPGQFKDFQIAAVCKEVVQGIHFIHNELSLYHGDLSCGTILLNVAGMIKIANIGESIARDGRITPGREVEDIKSIGCVMMELMEPITFMLQPRSVELRDPNRWRDGSGIKDFLRATQYASLGDLKNVTHPPYKINTPQEN